MTNFDVIIVGGGASGLMCAGTAAARGLNVALLERNSKPGRKVMITGKGRCNVTNFCDTQDFLSAVRRNPRFLYSAMGAFSCYDTYSFFEELGVPLKVERGNRVFPVSDKSQDIVDALINWVKASGATILQQTVTGLIIEDGAVKGVRSGANVFTAKSVVLSTGGKSYPITGSTGDGHAFAREAGHQVSSLSPSLIPIVLAEKWCSDLMGLSLKNVVLTVMDKDKQIFSAIGEMLFTHFGVSGPLILSASTHMEINKINRYKLYIDLKPGLDDIKLDARLLRDFEQNLNKDLINSLGELLPRKMIPVVVKLSGISPNTKVNQITKEQRQALVKLLKNFPMTPTGFRPIEEAIVTTGGVSVNEVSPKTMESKLIKGLFFTGELLDLDAYTGGYNLQIAWCTGHIPPPPPGGRAPPPRGGGTRGRSPPPQGRQSRAGQLLPTGTPAVAKQRC
ncbi:MAG: NAD(P)/FAD-dependent oxidoreductase [Oscillospiraceae bacterium]